MSEDKGQQEPSMEDILASIRRILSEDDGKRGGNIAPAAEPAPPKAAPKPAKVPPVVEEPPPPPKPEPVPEPEPEPIALMPDDVVEAEDDVLDLTDDMSMEPLVPEPEPEPEPDFEEEEKIPPPESEARPIFEMQPDPDPMNENPDVLLERTTQDVSEQAFASLASVLAQRNLGTGQLGVTLEELVRELLYPVLKAWLDENMPRIVERIVESEVEHIVNRIGPIK